MLSHLNIPSLVLVPMSRRREYRGDPKHPMLDKGLLYAWIAEYEAVVAALPADRCAQVVDKYESRVAQYGYSLRNLKRVVPTLRLKDFLLPPTSPLDASAMLDASASVGQSASV